jgi:hypothetical protein
VLCRVRVRNCPGVLCPLQLPSSRDARLSPETDRSFHRGFSVPLNPADSPGSVPQTTEPRKLTVSLPPTGSAVPAGSNHHFPGARLATTTVTGSRCH